MLTCRRTRSNGRARPPFHGPKRICVYKALMEAAMLRGGSHVVEYQVLADVLKRKEIYSYFSRSAMEKAHVYQAQPF